MANRLVLELLADANPMVKGMAAAQKSIDEFVDASNDAAAAVGGKLSESIDKFMNFSKGGASAAGLLAGGITAAAAAATAFTISAGRQVEALGLLSQQTGISTHTLQGWSVILKETNTEANTLARAMVGLSRKVTEARDPASNAAAAFKALNIDITKLGSTEDIIKAIADRFHEMPDGIDKSRFATELMSEAGLQLIQALNRGGDAFDKSTESAKKFAAILDPVQAQILQTADDAMDRLGLAAESLKNQLGSVFAPTLLWAVDTFTDMIAFLARFVKDLDVALDTLAIRITHIGLAAKEVASVLFSGDALSGSAWKQVAENISLIDKEAAKLIVKRRELAEVLEGPGAAANLSAVQFPEKAAKEASAKAAKSVSVPGLQMDEHVKEFKEVQDLTTRYRQGLIALANESAKAIRAELDVYFETEKKLTFINEQEELGREIVAQSTVAWRHRNDSLEMAVERTKAIDEAQQVTFAMERSAFGAADAARRSRMQLIEAEGALQKRMIEENIMDETRRKNALEVLDIELDTKRRQTIQQYPSFFEQQMQSVVQSNAFSISQISTTWTSGLANAAVNGGNFVEQAWKSTQVAVLQGLLNFGIQKAAALALQASQEAAIMATSASSEVAINTAKNATIVAGDAAAATATTSIWAGAGAAITGTFGAMAGAISLFFTGTLIPMFVAVGTAVTTFLSAIASSLTISVFGAAFSVPVWAAVGLVAAAIGVISAFAFADGGIVTGPTMGMIGEAGSNEAVIPLNKRGASFMRDALGGGSGGGGSQTVIVQLDGKQIARATFDNMPSVMRVRGISA